MNKNSTPETFIRHLYGETTKAEKEQVGIELALDESCFAEFNDLLEAKNSLNLLIEKPSETSLKIIMEHSHRTEHLQES